MTTNDDMCDIPGYEGYHITKDGRVFSTRSRYNNRPTHELKGWIDRKGYVHVGLMKDGKIRSFSVHKLQELVFLGGPKEGLQIDHIDGNKQNNDISNLRQVTPYENTHNDVTLTRFRTVVQSQEYRAKRKAIMQEKFKDPDFRQRVANGAQIRLHDPKWIENHSKAMEELWNRPEHRAMTYRNLDKMNNDPEIRKYNALRSKEVNSRACKAIHQDGTVLTFDSVTACANHFNLSTGTITRHLKHKKANSSGWRFVRPDKE